MEPRRRLSDKIIEAHGQACTEGKLEVGGGVSDKRQNTEMLEAAYGCHQAAKNAAKT